MNYIYISQKPIIFLGLFSFLIFSYRTYGQNTSSSVSDTTQSSSIVAPAGNSTATDASKPKIDVTSGSELQGGIGNFGDPSTHHGFALTMNGSLGLSNKPNTFGYDAFAVNTRWVPGTNSVGKRIIIQFGAANWFTPALAAVYKDTVLNATEKLSEPKTVNNIMAGLAFQLGNSRELEEADFTQDVQKQLRSFNLALLREISAASPNQLEIRRINKEIAEYTWKNLARNSLRKFSLIVGGMFRLGSLGTETDITAADLFATVAKGKGIFDFVGSIHYLKPLKQELIANNAKTLNLGFFVDLDDNPPINTMGLSLGFGRYNYYEKTREIEVNKVKTVLTDTPNTFRFDATLSFSGLFKDLGPFGSSIGFRYSHLNHSSTSDESQFAILFTTKFVNNRN